jgi:hypothetical protein
MKKEPPPDPDMTAAAKFRFGLSGGAEASSNLLRRTHPLFAFQQMFCCVSVRWATICWRTIMFDSPTAKRRAFWFAFVVCFLMLSLALVIYAYADSGHLNVGGAEAGHLGMALTLTS